MKKLRTIFLKNTFTRKREPVQTFIPGKLTMYSCGPTVYGWIHVGNLRGAVVADLIVRVFQYFGYKVAYVRNYTDIDDKIIRQAKKEGLSTKELAEKYILEVEKDFHSVSLNPPTIVTRATEWISQMIQMIQVLLDKGHAYEVDGNVFFSVKTFSNYGKLSRKTIEDLLCGARVEIHEKKKDPLDFALWKVSKEGEPFWESPWGLGRPGWHLECSVMGQGCLGEQFDLHHGGEDLIFPHHENEITQSESASGKSPFVRCWVHHAFVTISREKMSKSLGNIFTARRFIDTFGGEVARFFLISSHYRSVIDFDRAPLEQALHGVRRLYEAKQKAQELLNQTVVDGKAFREDQWIKFVKEVDGAKEKIEEVMVLDLNTPEAFSVVFSLIRSWNRFLKDQTSVSPKSVLAAKAFLSLFKKVLVPLLGIGGAEPQSILQKLDQIGSVETILSGKKKADPKWIEEKIQVRKCARREKDFFKADAIRKELEHAGVLIQDTPKGTIWHYL